MTPWLKLLPCRNHAGVAQLLNPLKIYTGDFHSMQTTVRRAAVPDPTRPGGAAPLPALELIQRFTVVMDLPKAFPADYEPAYPEYTHYEGNGPS